MYPKSRLRDPTTKIHVHPFQIGKNIITKMYLAELLPFGKMSSTITLCPAQKIFIIVFFVPMAWCILGMTSVGDRANFFEDG
jgi:hypothetical protein